MGTVGNSLTALLLVIDICQQFSVVWGKIRYITFPHHIEFKRKACYNGEKSGIVLVPDGGKQNGKAGSHPRR